MEEYEGRLMFRIVFLWQVLEEERLCSRKDTVYWRAL